MKKYYWEKENEGTFLKNLKKGKECEVGMAIIGLIMILGILIFLLK